MKTDQKLVWRSDAPVPPLRLHGVENITADLRALGQRAEVIKVEHPIRGDDTRAWGQPSFMDAIFGQEVDHGIGPPFAPHQPGVVPRGPADGESAYFLAVRRPIFLTSSGHPHLNK